MRRLLAAALVGAVAVLLAAAPADAGYQSTRADLIQWEWASVAQPGRFQVTDLVVRSDGWMIVSTGTYADGYLHLVPPWGAPIDASNRLGSRALGFRQLELRRGRLFGLRQETQRQRDRTHNPGVLVELDAETGEVIREHGEWWFQDLAVDPVTEDLVLQTSGGEREPYRHDLVRYNPERGAVQTVVPDTEPASDRAFEVAYSQDGQLFFTANVTDVSVTIDVRHRDGTRAHTLQSGQVDAMVMGLEGTCYEGTLLYTRYDGSVWGIGTASGSAPTLLAAGGHAGVVSYAALDRGGHLATARFADVTLLACPGFTPPTPPAAALPAAPAPPGDAPPIAASTAPVEAAPAAKSVPAATPAPAQAAPPPPPPPAPAPVPVAPPSAFGGAVQAAGAPSVGAADSPDEEHITSVAASARTTLTLSVGAVVAMALVSYALAVPPSVPRLSRVRGTR
jgi:hypothetical protein